MTLASHIRNLGGTRFFYKEGGGGGFRCMMRVYPGDGIGTVVMTNATGFDVRGLLDEIDARSIGGRHPRAEDEAIRENASTWR